MKLSFPGRYKKILAIISGSLFFLFTIFMVTLFSGYWGPLPGKKALAQHHLDLATLIRDHRGEIIGKLYREDRQEIHLDSLPSHLVDALIATEDVRFYEHSGTDTKSLFRVLFKTIAMGDASSGGGSTLTQQLAKNLFGRKKRGPLSLIAHKIRESVIASRLEELYTKEEILEKYLNTVSFPDNTYGIESASRRFFSKSASALTIPEAATLIGSLKATHTYNPRRFPDRSFERRNVVLHQMMKYGKIAPEAYEQYRSQPTVLQINTMRSASGHALYFREQVRKELEAWAAAYSEQTGKEIDLYTDGLRVKTTLDLEMQVMAEKAMAEHMSALQQTFEGSFGSRKPWDDKGTLAQSVIKRSVPYQKLKSQGLSEKAIMDALHRPSKKQVFTWDGDRQTSMSTADSLLHYLKLLNLGWVSLHPSSGAVRTWIGGIDHNYIQYDHVVQSKRQVGSVFKPIVYATAIEQGVPACTYYDLRKVAYSNLEDWTPDNASEDDDKDYMNYSMQYALSRSVNTVSVKVMEDAGIGNVVETARKMGITSELPPVPSLALGTASLSVLEVAEAYTTFVNKGVPVASYIIEEISDKDGKVLYRHETPEQKDPALAEDTSLIMLEMLKSVVREGTAKRLPDVYGISGDIAGKTGTTQDNKDGWFVGITPEVVSVSWVGLDDQRLGFRSTRTGQGANSALPLFALWWKQLQRSSGYHDLTTAQFTMPDAEVTDALDCDPEKKDGFFKRLFKNPDKTRKKEFKGVISAGK